MRRAALDLVAVGAALAVYGIARLLFNSLGLRWFGPETVGALNLALAWAVLASLPASAGAAAAVSRYVPIAGAGSERDAAHTLVRLSALGLAATLAPALLGLAVWPWIAAGTERPGPFGILALAWTILYALYALARAYLFAQGRARRALLLELAALAAFAAALVPAASRPSLAWLPLTVYYVPASVFLLSAVAAARTTGLRAPREQRSFATRAALGSAAGLGVQYLSTVFVAHGLSLGAAGLWATLMSTVAPLLLVPRTLNSSFFPRLARYGATDSAAFLRLATMHQRLASVLALPTVAVALVLQGPVLGLALGERAAPDLALPFILVCLGTWASLRGEPVVTALGALGHAGATMAAAFGGAALAAFVWIAGLATGRGLSGIAAGFAAYSFAVPALLLCATPALTRGRPRPPLQWFAADVGFALCTVLALSDIRPTGAALALLALAVLALAAHGAWRLVAESRAGIASGVSSCASSR